MVLVTAATRWEAEPLEKRLQNIPNLRVVRTGIGPVKARQAVERLELDDSPLTVISSGLAGALQPGMRCADLAMDVREAPLELVQAARATAESLKIPLHLGVFLSTDHVVGPDKKRELGAKHRALAVDMESSALREWTIVQGGTFLTARAVLDEMDDELPTEAPEPGIANSLKFAARHWRRLPALIGLGLKQRRAMLRLSSFLEEWLKSI